MFVVIFLVQVPMCRKPRCCIYTSTSLDQHKRRNYTIEKLLKLTPPHMRHSYTHATPENLSEAFSLFFWCSRRWCEFMWRITNQILIAGVKKSHTYDEAKWNTKRAWRCRNYEAEFSLFVQFSSFTSFNESFNYPRTFSFSVCLTIFARRPRHKFRMKFYSNLSRKTNKRWNFHIKDFYRTIFRLSEHICWRSLGVIGLSFRERFVASSFSSIQHFNAKISL